MIPLVAYALFGTSSVLAVGPVAIAALMTASAVAPYSAISISYGNTAAVVMALISGLILLTSGFLRLGFLANFISHPVINGFISAASLVIAGSQLPTLLGFSASGDNLIDLTESFIKHLPHTHTPTLLLSLLTLTILICTRRYATSLLRKFNFSIFWAQTITRSIPAILVLAGTILMQLHLSGLEGVRTVGEIPNGLPSIQIPNVGIGMWRDLWLPSLLITIVGYVESISVAQNLAMRRREYIDPDQEMIALGLANIAAGISSGLPVTGGVSRSVVNADAGAVTPVAGLLTAIGMVLGTLMLASWLSDLPKFILASTITVAVISLFDFGIFKRTLKLSYHDFMALIITFVLTLLINVEWGISSGVILSIGLHLYRSSRPHTAVVGQVVGTEHFRNVERHVVRVCPNVVTLRIDESLYFANVHYLKQRILKLIAENSEIKHLILMFSAVNNIDTSAVEILESINLQLRELNIGFHLSEIKGPVMDNLKRSNLLQHLNGKVFLTQFNAYEELNCVN
jgi:SulP family sulfate permease